MAQSDTPNRSIPDSQNKIDDDMPDDVGIQTMERAQDLSRHYEHIKDNTVDDGTVYGTVKAIDTSPGNNRIHVTYSLPAESSTKKHRFKEPKVWSDDYKFVRWVRHYGYDADSFPSMLRDKCKVKVETDETDGGYDLYIPKEKGILSYLSEVKTYLLEIDEPVSVILLLGFIVHSILAMGGVISYDLPVEQFISISGVVLILSLVAIFVEAEYKNL